MQKYNLNRINWQNPINWRHPLNRGLVSWWFIVPNHFGWGTGTFRDICTRNNLQLNSMDRNTCWLGNYSKNNGYGSLDFDGVDDYIGTTSTSSSLSAIKLQITLSMWFYADTLTSNFYNLLEWNDDVNQGTQFYVTGDSAAAPTNTRTLFTNLLDLSANSHIYQGNTNIISSGKWYHIVLIRNETEVQWYINGNTITTTLRSGSTTIGASDILQTTYKMSISRRNSGGGTFYFDGKKDDIRLYNRALSALEVLQLYKLSLTGNIPLMNKIHLSNIKPRTIFILNFKCPIINESPMIQVVP